MSAPEPPTLLEKIQTRIEALERHPWSWGGPETVDIVAILFVEIRAHLACPKAMALEPKAVRRAYAHFVASINGESTNTFLHAILRQEGRLEELGPLLGDFARWVAQEMPPETPDGPDLAAEVRRLETLAAAWEQVHRALAAYRQHSFTAEWSAYEAALDALKGAGGPDLRAEEAAHDPTTEAFR